jgi:probable F420-dependent oxidoreductase
MEFGIQIFATDRTLQPVELAKAVEERGFESLWLPEHSHIPTSRKTPWGGRPGAPPLPEKYWRCHDIFVSLAAAAAVTDRLKLCTGITLVPQRDPIWLAKEVASLDVISQGRVILGVGYGWNREEMEHHGVDPFRRRELFREKILLMKALWTQEEASFDGELLHLEPSWAWPKPVQAPHPPIVLGAGLGPTSLAHIVELCDGWMPNRKRDLEVSVERILEALADAGRDPGSFEFTYYGASPDPEFISELELLGFRRVVFRVESDPPEQVLATLDDLARFVDSL